MSKNGLSESDIPGKPYGDPDSNWDEARKRRYERELRDAAERHSFVQHVLEKKGSFFPSLDEMKEDIGKPDSRTLPGLKGQIRDMKEKHRKDVQDLVDYQAETYWGEVLDATYSSEIVGWDKDTQYSHLQTITPLQQRRTELEKEELERRQRLDRQFPSSIGEYHAISNKDVRLRIARFLFAFERQHQSPAHNHQKEKMMNEFGWAFRQVKPLCDEYAKNAEFKAEVQEILKDVEVRDPRRKPS
ncbi:hypothetical protein GLOTRDRAFT_138252 [Gloeophyllum trabeum ATCC 11539]|uniref:Uncharacterized protein n=1 Tax=Gloeophyllum trabeum (strain ATCC 11539 / FP-39264 / Madison 617) TaxID=670483 RepID=S7Q9F4_GLOTA|nr:uncharacterized protein GLOTRDRAFT_138252 [Gloeophyllum trabeum ATCC 11539]EPQ56551.1 hypothetical protein GLOTRDRAFT_138252 [Gloeophyllum trabeum ATCC 11539]